MLQQTDLHIRKFRTWNPTFSMFLVVVQYSLFAGCTSMCISVHSGIVWNHLSMPYPAHGKPSSFARFHRRLKGAGRVSTCQPKEGPTPWNHGTWDEATGESPKLPQICRAPSHSVAAQVAQSRSCNELDECPVSKGKCYIRSKSTKNG